MKRKDLFVHLVQTAGLVCDLHRQDGMSQAVWYVHEAAQVPAWRLPRDLERAAWEFVDSLRLGKGLPSWARKRRPWPMGRGDGQVPGQGI